MLQEGSVGQNLPPPRQSVHTLVEWMCRILVALSVLGFLHLDLLAANQSQRGLSPIDPLDAALAAGKRQRDSGHYAAALQEFQHGLQLARNRGDIDKASRCLLLISVAQTVLFRYRAALATAHEAMHSAQQIHNFTLEGAASGNISTIYAELGDFAAAEQEAARAVSLLESAPSQEEKTREFLVRALLARATYCLDQGKSAESEKWYRKTVALVKQIQNPALEAFVWDASGTALLQNGQVAEAGKSFERAYRFWLSANDSDNLAVVKEHLAQVEIRKPKPNYAIALQLIDEAFAAPSKSFRQIPEYYSIHIRAQILLGLGKKPQALAEFGRAVNSADEWRQASLPGDTTSSRTVAWLHDVYCDFAQLAAEISLPTNNSELKNEALEVLAANRAASLREQLTRAFGQDFRLSEDYYRKLSQLQAAQARVTLGLDREEDKRQLEAIRLDLGALENQFGFQIGKNDALGEKKSRRNSLRDIQARLSSNQLLLSFCLGKQKSFLWAVSREQVNLYQLEDEIAIGDKAAVFNNAVIANTVIGVQSAGERLSQALFGQLPPRLRGQSEWMIVGDGALLKGIPFAALPEGSRSKSGDFIPLSASHSLRLLPSELLLLRPKTKQAEPRFVGLGDPIYNLADSRLGPERGSVPVNIPQAGTAQISLARLVGSGNEIQTASDQSGLPRKQLLTGPHANSAELQATLRDNPRVLHFAVHVVSPPEQPGQAALALSLKNGFPELLTTEEIATFRLPESLVVLSGCSSGQGKDLPGAGLMGLGRAWLLAGAAAVVVSSWSTPDDSGLFFSAFYRHFQIAQTQSGGPGQLARAAALALQQAQLDMQRSTGYKHLPAFWAAYSVISRE
jgi:CHAT domain-containing protein